VSQGGVQDSVHVSAKGLRVNAGQVAAPLDQIGRGRATASSGAQLGHLGAITRDDEHLAAGNPVQDFSPVVAQLSNGD
jgi:hypothetical protein